MEEFVRTAGDPGVDNLQTRLISGREPGKVLSWGSNGRPWRRDPSRLDEEALEEAKRNLESFLVVGLTERFDESFILVRRALGWKLPMYETHNVTRRPKSEPPSPEAIEAIRERNRLDLELYDHARKLFSAAVERQGSSFRREVAVFRALNRIPNSLGPRIPTPLRHPLRSLLPR
jgi:Galactose-3-O-sulfotransferase